MEPTTPETIGKTRIILLILMALFNGLPVWMFPVAATLDGPQHLYTSRLIISLLQGDETISQFVTWNDIVPGNMLGQFLLALFNSLFPAFFAEKLLIFILLSGLAGSFFYLVASADRKPGSAALIILPFSNLALINHGFYNIGLGLILLFLALGFWVRNQNTMSMKQWAVLGMLILLIYLAHFFVFMVAIACFATWFAWHIGHQILKGQSVTSVLKFILARAAAFTLVSLPAICLAWAYGRRILELGGDTVSETIPAGKLFYWLLQIRPLTSYHVEKESIVTYALFGLLVLSAIVIMFSNDFVKRKPPRYHSGFWLTLSVLVLTLYFVLPEGTNAAGNVSLRLSTVFFLFLCVWLALHDFPFWFRPWFVFLLLAFTIAHRYIQQPFRSDLSSKVTELTETEPFIEPNSALLAIKCTDNWIDKHFPLYTGADKPLMIINNTQFGGLFPLVWNKHKMPAFHLGPQPSAEGFWWYNGNPTGRSVTFDYVIIWGGKEWIADSRFSAQKLFLEKYYERIYTTHATNAMLYRVIPENRINLSL